MKFGHLVGNNCLKLYSTTTVLAFAINVFGKTNLYQNYTNRTKSS